MGTPPDYEPPPESSIAAIAARGNSSPQEVAYDYLTEGLDRFLFFPIVNYVDGDHAPIREMLTDPATLLGLSDGGAHCGAIVDASVPTFMLTHWGRDRTRGPRLPLEQLVKMQTSETADFFGFHDRGRLAPGLRADVNLIDFDRLRLHQPESSTICRPAGGASCSAPTAIARRWSPARRSSRTAKRPAPVPGGSCAPGADAPPGAAANRVAAAGRGRIACGSGRGDRANSGAAPDLRALRPRFAARRRRRVLRRLPTNAARS